MTSKQKHPYPAKRSAELRSNGESHGGRIAPSFQATNPMSMTNEEIDKLTEEQKNARIAEACGWKRDGQDSEFWYRPDTGALCHSRALPDYCRDLNAMHEAERHIAAAGHMVVYESNLKRIVNREWSDGGYEDSFANSFSIHATATQRADAFLLTV